MTLRSYSEISFNYRASHPSKVVCIVEEADINPHDISFIETDDSRFYIHSERDYCQVLSFYTQVGVDSRLFCRIVDIGVSDSPVYEYFSAPFVVRYSSVSLEYQRRENSTFTFRLSPKGLYAVMKSELMGIEKGLVQVECSKQLLATPGSEVELAVTVSGVLPLEFTIDEKPNVNYRLQCVLFSMPEHEHRPLLASPLSVVVAPIYSESPVVFFSL